MVTTVLATILLLGVLIFVHELGHFLAAKALGVRVERFSMGFPPKMIGKKFGETEYLLSWIPLGGYVKMFGENPDESDEIPPEEQARSFSHKPAWARFLIVFAGPGFNFFFAFLVFWAIFTVNGLEHQKPIIGQMDVKMPAAQAGMQAGDRVVALDGQPVDYFDDILMRVQAGQGREVEISVDRRGQPLTFKVQPYLEKGKDILGDNYEEYSIGISPYLTSYVGGISPGMPADQAGIKTGDRIVSINGEPTKDWYDILHLVRASRGQPLKVKVDRNGENKEFVVRPHLVDMSELNDKEQVYRIGIQAQEETVTESIGPFRALYRGALQTWLQTRLIVRFVYKMIQGKFSPRKALGGPIRIGELAGQHAKEGMLKLIMLAAVLSINLGILNLLPIPVLDGGHLFFFFLEMVFRLKVSLNVQVRAQQAGFVLLMLFMVFIFYNDIARIVSRGNQPQPSTEQHETVGSGNVDPDR